MSRYIPYKSQEFAGIPEHLKISITKRLDQFVNDDDDRSELAFEPSLTSNERKYIHNYCVQFGLKTKSHGVEPNRHIVIYKKDTTNVTNKEDFDLSLNSQHAVIELRKSLTETRDWDPNYGNNVSNLYTDRQFYCRTGRLSTIRPQVPRGQSFAKNHLRSYRQDLPIFQFRDNILTTIDRNKVVIISGDTGCGKTTQVPQYLLENCTATGQPCRIICCEPRRLAAISVADRICFERDEEIGNTVGYQIRLESRVSNNTVLTFCTNGVILRTLMANSEELLRNVTHIIIDEVHERDRFSDFLLLIMKQILKTNRNIKLILMSATFNLKRFVDYFDDNCPIIEIPGRQYPVDEYFLEDVLKATGYMTLPMARYKQKLDQNKRRVNNSVINSESYKEKSSEAMITLKEVMDNLLKNAWVDGTDEAFEQLLDFVTKNNELIDYKHSETGVSSLICSAGRNKRDIVEALIYTGADVTVRSPNNMTAYEWADYFGHKEITTYLSCVTGNARGGSTGVVLTDEDKELLDIYHNCFNDDDIDCQLICAVLEHIMRNSSSSSAILMFLPGLEDILAVRDSILLEQKRFNPRNYQIFILHSQMQSSDQKRVFNRLPNNCRKIILATNIAETSLTIDDVVFVIDLGKVKEKSFDSLMGISSLKSVWVSQSSVKQRRGRAGRTRAGVCYHMYSKSRYQSFQSHQLPEILRIPIHELCLQTKLLMPDNRLSIHEFLSQAMDSPSITSVRTSIQLLKTIDALDSMEQLTQLGLRLLDLPIEPNYGKMIFYSIILKCVDPVVTIVSSFAYRDPFMIPTALEKQKSQKDIKKQFYPNNSMSDHIIYLNVFNRWLEIQTKNERQLFCRKYLISNTSMEVIEGIRKQLFGQLMSAGFIKRDSDEHNINADKWSAIKAALCAGAYPKLIRFDKYAEQFWCQKNKIKFHGSSLLNNFDNKFVGKPSKLQAIMPKNCWYIYEELINTGGRTSLAKTLTAVSAITVALFSGKPTVDDNQTVVHDLESDAQILIDEWIQFDCDRQIKMITSFLKQELHNVFVRQIDGRNKSFNQFAEIDRKVIHAVVSVLEIEDQMSGFSPVEPIYLRPQFGATVQRFAPPIRHKFESREFYSDRQFRHQRNKFSGNKSNNTFY
ncbi:3'-5' RNA helicase YTHDC2-like [Oppia nitens]|uniref:3'-5' RNA helicase YTHDC2-like n=1 Tax=Oppia nitens TaxID=1686743 RepID=UPI0023DC1A47|nr:3'-5' RNA helicase YTHDC2-like [Oppia nitens]